MLVRYALYVCLNHFLVSAFDIIQSLIAYFTMSRSCSVQCVIVHKYEMPVFGFLDVDFYHITSHFDDVLNGSQ